MLLAPVDSPDVALDPVEEFEPWCCPLPLTFPFTCEPLTESPDFDEARWLAETLLSPIWETLTVLDTGTAAP